MEDTDFYGVYITDVYDMHVEKLYEIIKKNTKYLDNINKSDIKDIKVNYYKHIIILLKNGKVYLDGIEQYNNIKELVFISGVTLLAISNEKQILTLTGCDNNTRFMTNNNYKYKKIIYTPLVVVALTHEDEIKMYGCLLDFAINYKNFYNVNDIAYVEDEEDIVVIKDDKIVSLLNNTEYYDVELVLTGKGNDYNII